MFRLITDFDGPIMDVSERYYQVYLYCLNQIQRSQQPIQPLAKSAFWNLKRAKVSEAQIGIISGLDDQQSAQFAQLRRQTVHTLPYFQYDCLIPDIKETLTKIQDLGVDLVVMTMRRVRELDAAFERYDLATFFPPDRRYCLDNNYVKTTDVQDKPQLMAKAIQELPSVAETWMIGDTEADIAAAKSHQVPIIGVLSGIRDRKTLTQYQPDRIAGNLTEAIILLQQLQKIPYR